MRNKGLCTILAILLLLTTNRPITASSMKKEKAQAFIGQDLYLAGEKITTYQSDSGQHIFIFPNGFSMSIGTNQFFSQSAVIWLTSQSVESRGRITTEVNARIFLQDNISIKKTRGAKAVDMTETIIKEDESMLVQFNVSGEVFVTADKRDVSDPRETELYRKAIAAEMSEGSKFVVQPGARVPQWPAEKVPPSKPGLIETILTPTKPKEPNELPVPQAEKAPSFRYPVNIAPSSETPLKMERIQTENGANIDIVTERFYIWQKLDEQGGLLELQADNAVIFYIENAPKTPTTESSGDSLSPEPIRAIYLSGDVVLTEGNIISQGQRTIQADEIYYDFLQKKAIAVNAVIRNFDAKRGIPIYVRAAKLQQLARNQFAAEDITLTSSEFHRPQISLTASKVYITDTTTVDKLQDDTSYDAQLHDVRMKVGETTVLHWPFMRSNLERPDTPLKSAHFGHDSIWGTSLETQWFLSRLLGLQEPAGTDSTLMMDYYSKRGVGAGAKVNYESEDRFGRILGYIINDRGEDRLGRYHSRRNLEPPRELRGRFAWSHRQFLPYNWQLTAELDYLSDENFLESYYRNEFQTAKERETYVHLKRTEENWGLSFLAKARLNDFADKLEELPSAEFHWTGQSLFDDQFTLYSDTQASRLRQRIGNDHMISMNEDFYAFVSHRTELDMPITVDTFKIVPFVAGSFGYDDRSGFTRTLVDGTNTGSFGEDKAWIGEIGVRAAPRPFWKVYPNVKSRLWDLNQLRHIIEPELTAVMFEENDSVVEQRDILNVALSQRLQTKRTSAEQSRTVDWMRLDMDITWVNDSEHDAESVGPDRFIWAKPIVPLRVLSAPAIFNGDLTRSLRRFELFGPRRNYFGADYVWRLSDTTALLSDLNFDTQSGVVNQFNAGFSRLVWPNLSYYIGSRYLRRVQVLNEKGSNALTYAATYILDPRYTLVFSQQYDFDYGDNIRSDVTLIRRYHRIFCSLTFSIDESLDRQAVLFSIWPQGVPELAIGNRRYMGLGGSTSY